MIRLLTLIFPLRCPPEFDQYSYGELRERYRRWDIILSLVFLALAPFSVYAVHEGFLWYTHHSARGLEPSVYTILPKSNFWYAPALVLGVILACLLVFFLYEALLARRAREYRYYANLGVGFNATRMYLAFGLVLGLPFGALGYFAAHSSLQLTQNEIVIHRLFSVTEERYAYAQVRALKDLSDPAGEKSIFVIELDGAEAWTTKVEVVFPDETEKAYLSRRAGIPIQHIVMN